MKKTGLFSYFIFIIALLGLPKNLFAQNVGVGITNPTRAKLEQHGAVGATSAIFGGESTGISLQSNWPAIGFNQYSNNGAKYIGNGYAAVQYLNPGNGSITLDMFGSGNANGSVTSLQNAFTVAGNGNIGIKAAPFTSTLLALKGSNFEGSAVFGGTIYNSHFNYGTAEHTYIRGGKNFSNLYLNDIASNHVVLGAGNSMVGINTGNPTYTLEIVQANNRGLLFIDPNSNFDNWEYRVNYYFSSAPNSYLTLYLNGQTRGVFVTNGSYSGIISDKRVKTNITDLPSGLSKLNLLRPVKYEMKEHNNNHEKTIGFIAQDVKVLFPGAVNVMQVTVDSANSIPDLHTLDYTTLSVISIKALQEQYEQIQALQKENDGLMKRLKKLESFLITKK